MPETEAKVPIDIVTRIIDYEFYDGTDESGERILSFFKKHQPSEANENFNGIGRVWIGSMRSYIRHDGGLGITDEGAMIEVVREDNKVYIV